MAVGLVLLVSADPVAIQQFGQALQELSITPDICGLESAFEIDPWLIANSIGWRKICWARFPSAASSFAISVSDHTFGFSSRTRNTREERPENTFVLRDESVGWFRSVLRRPKRCSVNLPGTWMETFPARSRKSMLFATQYACACGESAGATTANAASAFKDFMR